MTEKITIRCYEPVQAHKALMLEIWPHLKAQTMAGNKMVLELKPETRSTEQNRKLWAMLAEVSEQVDWYGKKLSAQDWKCVFSASLKKQDAVPGIDGGFVVLGQSTSKMAVREMADLITLIEAFGAQKGVKFSTDQHDDKA